MLSMSSDAAEGRALRGDERIRTLKTQLQEADKARAESDGVRLSQGIYGIKSTAFAHMIL